MWVKNRPLGESFKQLCEKRLAYHEVDSGFDDRFDLPVNAFRLKLTVGLAILILSFCAARLAAAVSWSVRYSQIRACLSMTTNRLEKCQMNFLGWNGRSRARSAIL